MKARNNPRNQQQNLVCNTCLRVSPFTITQVVRVVPFIQKNDLLPFATTIIESYNNYFKIYTEKN